ncbi:hypothetical protein [Paractinoplanes maris]|uniref:hypothetical protein n=1 Tax=Paractinoplanes maris TaxID=1734446 RepID=UPI002020FDBF|nr:hypothetical protein [Actinoplanes maris]
MSLLRRTRTEVAGAWRSLRYDLGRTPPAAPPAGGPDVTSTGMGTWGLDGLVGRAEPAPPARRPRRAVAVTALGMLTVVGATGAYLVVVNGLGSLVTEKSAAAGTFPPRAAVTTSARMGPSSTPGRVAATRTAAARPAPAGSPKVAPVVRVSPVPPAAAPRATDPPARPTGPKKTMKPASPECHCEAPVPTPTAPAASPTPSPSVSPSPQESPSESAEPSDSVSPSRSWDGHRRRRHH